MIRLALDSYTISKETLALVLEALDSHWFSHSGTVNNDDVIEAQQKLTLEIRAQEVK